METGGVVVVGGVTVGTVGGGVTVGTEGRAGGVASGAVVAVRTASCVCPDPSCVWARKRQSQASQWTMSSRHLDTSGGYPDSRLKWGTCTLTTQLGAAQIHSTFY